MQDISERLVLYKRLANAAEPEDVQEMRNELEDRFGTLPAPAHAFVRLMELRPALKRLAIESLRVSGQAATFLFDEGSPLGPDRLIAVCARSPKTLRIRPGGRLVMTTRGGPGASVEEAEAREPWEDVVDEIARLLSVLLDELARAGVEAGAANDPEEHAAGTDSARNDQRNGIQRSTVNKNSRIGNQARDRTGTGAVLPELATEGAGASVWASRAAVLAAGACVFLAASALSAGYANAEEMTGEAAEELIEVPRPGGSRLINGVVATVDGEALTLRDLISYRDEQAPFVPENRRGDYAAALQGLIESRLLEAEYEKHGIRASDPEVQLYIQRVMQQSNSTPEQVQAALAEEGLSYEYYFERMRGEVKRLSLVDFLIRSRVNVSEEEIERVWETDPRFLEDEQVEIAHIYIRAAEATPEALDAAYAKAVEIRDGLSRFGFGGAAKEHSDGPTAEDGGYLGKFTRAEMAAHFRDAIADLDDGDISEAVRTADGAHVVRLLDTHSKGRVPLESIADELREEIYQKRLEERFTRWAKEDLRNDHHITVSLEELALLAAS